MAGTALLKGRCPAGLPYCMCNSPIPGHFLLLRAAHTFWRNAGGPFGSSAFRHPACKSLRFVPIPTSRFTSRRSRGAGSSGKCSTSGGASQRRSICCESARPGCTYRMCSPPLSACWRATGQRSESCITSTTRRRPLARRSPCRHASRRGHASRVGLISSSCRAPSG
jgi:hypothetical protein